MSGITNGDLEKLCKKLLNNNFLGVFPSDVTPKSKKFLWSVIFNLSPHYEEGSHFVAIIKRKRKIFYFDSFGKQCSNGNLITFMKYYKLPIEYNKIKIQSDTSSLCGYYCFYFLHEYFLKNKSYKEVISKFHEESKELVKNDLKLLNFIVKIVNNKK